MSDNNPRQEPTLVVGGTGKIGRRVAQRLTARGLPVRIGSRSGEPRFDWEDRSTWEPILEGVGSAYVSHYLDAIPGAAEALGSFAELAVQSGVPRLVLLSGRGEQEAERAERAVRGSGAELTVLRSTWFAQNFSEEYWQEQVQSNEVALPTGDTPEPFVDADDIADVAVAALTDERHVGEIYELTGPRLLTFAEAVREISRVVGREIRYVPVSIEDFAWSPDGHPDPDTHEGLTPGRRHGVDPASFRGRDQNQPTRISMRKIKSNFFISLDGVVEAPDQWHFPYFDEEMGTAVGAAFATTDAILMGRVLYDEWAGYWPEHAEEPFGDVINSIKKYVVSDSLRAAEWQNTEIISGDVVAKLTELKARDGGDITMSGSAITVRSLLRAGLLDELNLLVHPVVAGGGMARLFPPDEPSTPLRLLSAQTFKSGVLSLSYGSVRE